MALKSLLAEITGSVPTDLNLGAKVVPGKRLVVIFEDTLGALRIWQNELLKINSQRLRDLGLSVACVPQGSEEPMLNGHAAPLPVAALREELQGQDTGKFEVLLLDVDGSVMLRSDGPVTIEQLTEAINMIGPSRPQDP
jgi:hypothetical protein